MILSIAEAKLSSGPATVVFTIIAVLILFIGIFRLDSLFVSRKRPPGPARPTKRRVHYVEEPLDPNQPDSSGSTDRDAGPAT